jgi:DNA-binding response OmpR family regulator
VETAVRERPDLILLDVVLPDENGIEVCARLKGMPETRHIPVILLTGDAVQVENKIAGIEGGAEDYIIKPFLPEEVLARVKGILKRNFNVR